MNILDFAVTHGNHIWSSDRHRAESLSKLKKVTVLNDFDVKPISEFKAKDVYSIIDFLEDKVSNSTINRYLACLSSVFKHAVPLEELERTPQVKWKRETNRRNRFFSDEEYAKLLKFFRHYPKVAWMSDFVDLAVQSGMRRGEILSINNPSSKTQGTLSEDGRFVHLSQCKNNDSRVVSLTTTAREALARLENQPYKFWSHRNFYDYWALARDEIAPGDTSFCFHTARHTTATNLILKHGIAPLAVATCLGHKSLQTTKKYVADDKENQMNIMMKLDRKGVA